VGSNPTISTKKLFKIKINPKTIIQKRIFINNQIRADRVRLIDQDGKQLGIFNLKEAIDKAQNIGLDLILVTQRVDPPVCKIMDYGKYLYRLRKKEKPQKKSVGGIKNIRLGFNISSHDLEMRVRLAQNFLKKGYKVRVEMILKGREKALSEFGREKMNQFLETLQKSIEFKMERGFKRDARGLTMIISQS